MASERPLDGITLKPLLDDQMTERPTPICFWDYPIAREQAANLEPYIDPELQVGTTPLVKLMYGIATRNFINYRHPEISEEDHTAGARAVLDNRYKLVIDAEGKNELFDLRADMGEKTNLTDADTAANLQSQLRAWQESVLQSLDGGDYA